MKVTFETTGAMRIVETKGGKPGMTAGALVLDEGMNLEELIEFEDRVEAMFSEAMDARYEAHDADTGLLNSEPHGPRGCVHRTSRHLGGMADTVFDRKQWRNSALDRMLDTKGSETDDQRD